MDYYYTDYQKDLINLLRDPKTWLTKEKAARFHMLNSLINEVNKEYLALPKDKRLVVDSKHDGCKGVIPNVRTQQDGEMLLFGMFLPHILNENKNALTNLTFCATRKLNLIQVVKRGSSAAGEAAAKAAARADVEAASAAARVAAALRAREAAEAARARAARAPPVPPMAAEALRLAAADIARRNPADRQMFPSRDSSRSPSFYGSDYGASSASSPSSPRSPRSGEVNAALEAALAAHGAAAPPSPRAAAAAATRAKYLKYKNKYLKLKNLLN